VDDAQNPNEPNTEQIEIHERKKHKPKICDVPSSRIKMARIEKIRQNDRTGILKLTQFLKCHRGKDSAMFGYNKQ